MTNKGFTLIELLIVIVVLGIVSAFSALLVNEIIENTRQDSFVVSAKTFLDAATSSYQQGDQIWDDNVATLTEIIDAGYIVIGTKDPWGGEYDFNESYVIADFSLGVYDKIYLSVFSNNFTPVSAANIMSFRIRLISTTATIGYDEPLADFSQEDIVFLDGSSGSLVSKIVSLFDNNINKDFATDDGDDEVNVVGDISKASVETLDGDDSITIGDDIKKGASIDMGDGNDTLIVGDDVKKDSFIDMGAGDDTVTINDDLAGGSILNTGSGNDTVTIKDDLSNATLITGTGDDSISIGDLRYNSTIDAGDGNDTLFLDGVSSSYDGNTTLGPGNDTLTILDNLKRTDGTFDGGLGDDTLNLPEITLNQWNNYASSLFYNFDTVVLKDTTIHP